MSGRNFKGAKYDGTILDAAVIAKNIREDIKQAVKKNELPKGKYSVRISRYSMGRSINIRAKEIEFPVYGEDGRLNKFGELLRDSLEKIRNAYNYDNSDIMTDYFDVNYYGGTDIVRQGGSL